MSELSVFKQILGADILQDNILAFLKEWMPTYLCNVDEQRGRVRGSTAWPKSWQVVPNLNGNLNKQLPAMLIVIPGTADKPVKDEEAIYRATYAVGIAVLVKARDQLSANSLAKRYAAAITACVEQQKGRIAPHVHAVAWDGDSYDDLPVDADRTLSTATVHFNIEMKGVVYSQAGPIEPNGELPTPKGEPKKETWPDPLPIPDEDHIHVTVVPKES